MGCGKDLNRMEENRPLGREKRGEYRATIKVGLARKEHRRIRRIPAVSIRNGEHGEGGNSRVGLLKRRGRTSPDRRESALDAWN